MSKHLSQKTHLLKMYNLNYLRPQIVNVWKIIVYVKERVNFIEAGDGGWILAKMAE